MKYPITHSEANISKDKKHRYSLTRVWNAADPMIMFIGLNPSRADHINNDATIIRCINFAQSWDGYGGMYFANLYSFRTPYVKTVPENEKEEWTPLIEAMRDGNATTEQTSPNLEVMINVSKTVVCCWGAWDFISEREKQVLAMIKEPWCFGVNAGGSPKHPLYLAKASRILPYERK